MSDRSAFTVLVVAKAPVAGLAKTRLCPPLTHDAAADIAAAALIDTLAAASEAVQQDRTRIVVSYTGSFTDAARRAELDSALQGCHLVPQSGATFAERLSRAHQDAADHRPGLPVVQIGMDTPHVNPTLLVHAGLAASRSARAGVLGDAADGGWWLLALANPNAARALATVPMSRQDTGRLSRDALAAVGVELTEAVMLTDVDTWEDAIAVSAENPRGVFARAVRNQLAASRTSA
jgi:glycosyltransferase A (GT-A) superfamily protein (DUF2064 family)